MKKLKDEIIENPPYADFIRENREILSGINNSILEMLTRAKEQNLQFSDTIAELIKLVDISTTIHQQYKNSTGDEEIFKLKALLLKLKKNYMADTIHLETSQYIAHKIETITNRAFTQIDPLNESAGDTGPDEPAPRELQYKWFTFSRNGSWFLRQYKSVHITGIDKNNLFNRDGHYYYEIDGSEREVIDLMSSPTGNKQQPIYLIRFDASNYLYASDENGKEVHANSDIVTPQLNELKDHEKSGYTGRVRLFGINYLLPEIR